MDDVMVMESDTAAADARRGGRGERFRPRRLRRCRPGGGGWCVTTVDESATDFSTTNVQVEGVDEPDIVKTDGARILALSEDGVLHYVDIDDGGGAGTKRGSVSITAAGWAGRVSFSGQEILVSGDRAFVIIHGGSEFPTPFPVDDVAFEESILTESLPGSGGRAGPTTTVVEVDLSNPDNLRIAGSLTLDGNYISARSIGDTARIAVTTPPTRFGFVFPSSPTAEESAAEANRELIRTTTVDDWVPGFSLASADGSQIRRSPRRLRRRSTRPLSSPGSTCSPWSRCRWTSR